MLFGCLSGPLGERITDVSVCAMRLPTLTGTLCRRAIYFAL
jgi:hypothetical protein